MTEIDAILQRLRHDIATQVVSQAKDDAPLKTGELQRSIDIIRETAKETVVGHHANPYIMKNWRGEKTPYPLFVHEGTKWMKKRPYLENAAASLDMDKTLDHYKEELAQEITIQLKKEVEK